MRCQVISAIAILVTVLIGGRTFGQDTLDELSVVEQASFGGDSNVLVDTNCEDCSKGCDDGCGKGGCGCSLGRRWLDNTSWFLAGDGWKNHGDDDDNNNFGPRIGFNSAFGFGESRIRGQIGASYGFYDIHGREDPEQHETEQQLFVTAGIYKRSKVCCGERFSWGLVYDFMNSKQWGEETDDITLAQIRYQIGYALSECNEVGVWGTFHVENSKTRRLGGGVVIRARDQLNIYLRRNWEFGANTTFYIGLADAPSGINNRDKTPALQELVIGLNGHAPLSHRVALFGNVHYIIPGTSSGDIAPNGFDNSYAEEGWNVTFGLVFYPGCKARADTVSGWAGLPLLPVADNGTFSVNTPAGAL